MDHKQAHATSKKRLLQHGDRKRAEEKDQWNIVQDNQNNINGYGMLAQSNQAWSSLGLIKLNLKLFRSSSLRSSTIPCYMIKLNQASIQAELNRGLYGLAQQPSYSYNDAAQGAANIESS